VDKVAQFTDSETEFGEWKVASTGRLGEFEFSAWHAGGRNPKSRRVRQGAPVSGSLFDGLSPAQFAVCNFHFRGRFTKPMTLKSALKSLKH